jgi:ubiquitin C-terminal hydrolase
MPNLDSWLNQSEYDQRISTAESTKLEKHLLSIRTHNQKQIKPNCHPTYNEDHEKRIEILDLVLKKYKDGISMDNQQQNEEQVVDNIIDELDNNRNKAIKKKKDAELKDEMLKYRLEEDTLDYVLFVIRDFTGRYYN